MIDYYEPGVRLEQTGRDDLYILTTSILDACQTHPFVNVVELRVAIHSSRRSEFIIIDAADGTVMPDNPAGIRRKERLAIEINPDNRDQVLVRTLRKSFPVLSHQHASQQGSPRTLCLYNVPWGTVERNWTPERFIERIFWWLRESAELKLHRDDQPLEQLFYLSPYQLILPSNYADYFISDERKLTLQCVHEDESVMIRAVPEIKSRDVNPVQLLPIQVPPVEAHSISSFPETLGKLHEQLKAWGSDLLQPLEAAVFGAVQTPVKSSSNISTSLLILVLVPRLNEGIAERNDVLGYYVNMSIQDVARAFDMLGMPDAQGFQYRVTLLGQKSQKWESIPLSPIEVRFGMNAPSARDMSAVDPATATFKGVLAGVGALGSALADIWVRECWGQWTLIDPDLLLPHNLCRHIGFDHLIGLPKTEVVRALAKAIYPHEPAPIAINKSILDEDDGITSTLNDAAIVVDVSTTFEVPRTLALREKAPRTVSLFLTPSGQSSVMLMEDAERIQRVDVLEGQYYRSILNNDWGIEHLQHHHGDRWAGGGCRDISVRMSNEVIHIHAGILSRQLRSTMLRKEARVCVWSSDDVSGAVSAHEISLFPAISANSGKWTVKYDQGLVNKLSDARIQALPNETGGAILGITDFKNRTIILVDVLPTPSDSHASPAHFVRGEDGQQKLLENAKRLTANVVDYVGEWHSHPQGYSARASREDEKLIVTLHSKMSAEGLPVVMLILSDSDINIVVR
ncbi:TPA: Mov34/MPN/PAD-1 family protein [Yersinia enterocolitica]|nr:Mov34/MPN/PAD-1 family protein [Yersinia enterocolitica]HDL8412191.1 Mov34/MPN/PAD-1 family protein [Yersinia enterocolitica]HDM8285644.1 Mov34/MPN/PAD-1 family protein [Yersinia enterocolitica]HEI6792384.1 Mov34/MPN/PAD-1 family protein [Yersinia enterocolitica]HEI6810378.1 Mov34/MPN/PAD-1 family protein [Yersinia enterocolitica]